MSQRGFTGSQLLVYLLVFIVVVTTLFPFYWMGVTSFKSLGELYKTENNPLIVLDPILKNYDDLFSNTLFVNWMFNSFTVSLFSTILSISAATLAGYALARLKFPGANVLGWGIFVTYLIPPTLLFLPLSQVVAQISRSFGIKLGNNLLGLILVYPTFLVPFGTWLLIGFFRSIPHDLEECAMIDGARRIYSFWRITLPLALPGVLSVAIFSFTLSWNEFLYALVLISDKATKTIPIGVTSELIRGDAFFWGQLMAGALLGSIPVALIYSFFVDQFVSGMTVGAVKG